MFGCPHFTLEEAKYIAEHIEGKKLAIPMYILVSSHALQMAERMGVNDILTAAGRGADLRLLPRPALLALSQRQGRHHRVPQVCVLSRRRGINFVIRDLDTCIEAALTGEVK